MKSVKTWKVEERGCRVTISVVIVVVSVAVPEGFDKWIGKVGINVRKGKVKKKTFIGRISRKAIGV